jgi:hypothetical protein
LSNEPFTTSVLFRTVAGKRNQVIFANFVACSYVPEGFALVVYNIDGQPSIALYQGKQSVGADIRLNDGRWHHAAGVFDVDTYALYVDGQLLGSGTGALAATDVQQIFRSKQP